MSDIISSDLSDDEKNAWSTDLRIFDAMNKEFRFSLDAAANHDNRKCDLYLTKEQDALNVDWSEYIDSYYRDLDYEPTVWINPPYGRGLIKQFMNKAIEQKEKGLTVVMLVPATLDAQWLPIHEISELRIITGGRLTFIHPGTGKPVAGNTKGSMFVIFRPGNMPCFVRLVDRDQLLIN